MRFSHIDVKVIYYRNCIQEKFHCAFFFHLYKHLIQYPKPLANLLLKIANKEKIRSRKKEKIGKAIDFIEYFDAYVGTNICWT
ncbi:hypothetical protein ACKWTF_008139 [Chironomus riparius]